MPVAASRRKASGVGFVVVRGAVNTEKRPSPERTGPPPWVSGTEYPAWFVPFGADTSTIVVHPALASATTPATISPILRTRPPRAPGCEGLPAPLPPSFLAAADADLDRGGPSVNDSRILRSR